MQSKRAPAAASASTKPAQVVAATDAAVVPPTAATEEAFWDGVPECLLMPLQGAGPAWLASVAVWTALGNILTVQFARVQWLEALLAVVSNLSVVALCSEFHRRCVAAVVDGESEVEPGLASYLEDFVRLRARAAGHPALFAAALHAPLLIWWTRAVSHDECRHVFDALQMTTFWLLASAAGTYWPMALAVAAQQNNPAKVWNVGLGLRALVRAPLEYAAIVFFSGLAFALPWLLGLIIVKILDLPGAFAAIIAGLPLAASHGVMGALSGQLLRARPRLFE